MGGKRDAKYLSSRLEREHPIIYAELMAGSYKSVRAASLAAGIIKAPNDLNVLRRAWKNAGASDRDAFRREICGSTSPSITPVTGPSYRPALGPDQYLTAAAKEAVKEILARRGISACKAVQEMGFSIHSTALSNAILNGPSKIWSIPSKVIEDWIEANIVP